MSWGKVVLTDPKMQLTTDTLHFDRTTQVIYYRNSGTLKDDVNVLKSRAGYYYLETNKYQALSDVVITNPDYVLESNHLDYFTNFGTAYLFGPTTITSKKNSIYCEKGFYDTKNNISHFTKNALIKYNDREIIADSLSKMYLS
ncbi:MAG: OstA-like protein [Flavobacteriaceae bacterium]|nr:OstA-like protein [Flavobacteriaceae bacterium]